MTHTIRAALLLTSLLTSSFAAGQSAFEWREHTGTTRPIGRRDHAMAYDSARGETVLFGGRLNTFVLRDTWLYDGNGWRQTGSGTLPPARADHAMAYDPLRDRVVLFGGEGVGASTLRDIWEWDGAQWTEVATGVPGVGMQGSACFDPGQGGVFYNNGSVNLLWDGQNARLLNVPSPDGNGNGAMVYDAGLGGPVLPYRSGIKRFDPVNGWQRIVDGGLFSLNRYAIAIDPVSHLIVMQGGAGSLGSSTSSHHDVTFGFDGQGWTPLPPLAGQYGRRAGHAMTYDLRREVFVLFGGDTRSTTDSDETWELVRQDAPASFQAFGNGCAAPGGTVPILAPETLFNSVPVLGGSFTLRLERTPSQQPAWLALGTSDRDWAGRALPFDLTPLGMAGCSLLVSPNIVEPFGTDGLGTGRLWITLPVPGDRSFLGAEFFVQALGADAAAPGPGLVWSNGGHGVIGLRP